MKTLKFKTNINCSGCVARVTPHLNKQSDINSWSVDTLNPEKILSVEGEFIDAGKIIELVSKAGFKVEEVK